MKRLRASHKAMLGVLVGAALLSVGALIAGTIAALTPAPTLSVEGLRFRVVEEGDNIGSVQASMDICVENISTAAGAYARLEYNPKYLRPSDKGSNEVITTAGLESNAGFFQVSSDLYAAGNPFIAQPNYTDSGYQGLGQSAVDTGSKYLLINLMTREDLTVTDSDEMKQGQKGEGEEFYYYLDTSKKKIVLCTLTFAVEAANIQTIVEKFGNAQNQPVDDYLFKVRGNTSTNWSLPYFYGDGLSDNYTGENGAVVDFVYKFAPTLIGAQAAEARVEVNARQGYTNGKLSDIAALLQTRSPMVTAGYADGSVENILLKWGEEKASGDYGVYHYENGIKGDLVTDATYTPTGGRYLVEQSFYYREKAEAGGGAEKKLPQPIQAEVIVTPINLTGVMADGLDKTYNLNQAFLDTYSTYDSLELPTEARLTTDVAPGGVSLTMPIPGWAPPDTGKMTDVVNGTGGHWPAATTDTAGIGTYSFAALPGTVDSVTPTYTAETVQKQYPWLTVPAGWQTTVVATRNIVEDGKVIDPGRYRLSAETGDDGKLTITVGRYSATDPDSLEAMGQNAAFRVRLPDGNVVDPTWFLAPAEPPQGSDYGSIQSALVTPGGYYTITIDPGETPSAGDGRELTRRAINLGGWFAVSVQEQGMAAATDFIPVLTSPRKNQYTEDKVYNFTGINAGLFSYIHPLGTTVTVPRGTYVPIDDAGVLQPDEHYGVTTTYDGATGGEPGRLHTFTVDAPWVVTGPTGGITTHGPNLFASTRYSGYGEVTNAESQKKLTVKTEAGDAVGDGLLKLTYEGTGGTVTTDADKNVKLALYDTKQYDYTSRQEYRFTLKNTGDTPIAGIYVPETDHFQVVGDGPAAYLPPHTSTTFVLTYRYGLEKDGAKGKTYKDTVSVVYDSTKAPLTFEAQFRVSAGPVRKVTIKLLPELAPDESMGTADLIVGEVKDTAAGTVTMDYTVNSPSYESGSAVYLSAVIQDEYAVEDVYYYQNNNESGTKVSLTYYDPAATGAAEVTEGTRVYYITDGMPTYNVTVYVKFKEPVYSKLRMTGLLNFAATDNAGLKPGTETPTAYEVWQKKFTESESGKTDLEKAKLGAAGTAGFDPNVNQYLVVIPATATVDQVEVTLRKLVIDFDGNVDIFPRVEMLLLGQGSEGTGLPIYDDQGTTVTPSIHISDVFSAPDKGKSSYVMVRLSAPHEDRPAETVFRYYYLEIARDTDEEIGTLSYGNSPYGMIMNANNISTADKEAAKKAFVDGGHRFDERYRPAKAAGMTKRYWPEAWVDSAGNYDLDVNAYFALLGRTCAEPGIADVVDSSGRKVPATEIFRSVEVVLQDKTTNVVLDLKTADSKTLPDFRVKADGSGNYAIRPGVYEMVYSYKDYDGSTIHAFKRPFIILGALGDMNADGWVVTGHDPVADGKPSDLDLLQNRIKYPMVLCDEITLFRLRSCDVNADGNINNVDANALRNQMPSVPFYLPEGY